MPQTIETAQDTRTIRLTAGNGWVTVCDRSLLTPGRGAAALLPDGRQVALSVDRAGRTYAIDNRDPFTGAYVLSRGLVGSDGGQPFVDGGQPFVASPLLKKRFDLATSACLDDDEVSVPVFEVRAD